MCGNVFVDVGFPDFVHARQKLCWFVLLQQANVIVHGKVWDEANKEAQEYANEPGANLDLRSSFGLNNMRVYMTCTTITMKISIWVQFSEMSACTSRCPLNSLFMCLVFAGVFMVHPFDHPDIW